jgi:hypothetical protein
VPTQPTQASTVTEEPDTADLKKPVLHNLQTGSLLVVPGKTVKEPLLQTVCVLQESIVIDEVDAVALNLPFTHSTHFGCEVVVPVTSV